MGQGWRARSAIIACFVASGCFRSTGEIPPPPEGTFITGTVVERDLTTAAKRPVASARVTVVGTSFEAATNADGFFQLTRVSIGVAKIAIHRPTASGGTSVAKVIGGLQLLVDGQTLALGEIELLGTGDLVGSVRLSDSDRVADAAGGLVVAAQTDLRAVVDSAGEYSLIALPEGAFDVVAFVDGYVPGQVPNVTVSPGEVRRVRRLTLDPLGAVRSVDIGGSVRLDGSDDASGVDITFVTETASTSASPREAVSEASGRYRLAAVPFGIYRAVFTKSGYRQVVLRGVAVLPAGAVGLVPVVLAQAIDGDLDGDGVPDGQDPDRDNDGCDNGADAFPDDPHACLDTDGDGIPDTFDTDDDDDDLLDAEEVSPGADGWITNPLDPDSDGDGFEDGADLCPTVIDIVQSDIDGDGVGDNCDSEPLVLGFSPGSAAEGERLVITGRRFNVDLPASNAVRFGVGGIVPPDSVTATQLVVTVPGSAADGPLTVFNGSGSGTSTASFTFVGSPRIDRISPLKVVPGGVLQIDGARFSGRTNQVKIAGLIAPVTGDVVVLDARLDPPTERLRVLVPALGPGLATVTLSNRGPPVTAAQQVEVLGPPSLTRVVPNPVGVGGQLNIGGLGFEVLPAGQVRVEFAGGVSATPRTITDHVIQVIVPDGAISGSIALEYPNRQAPVTFDGLVVDANLPTVSGLRPLAPRVGDEVAISGRNLAGATEVRFGSGGATAPAVSGGPSRITVTTPAGALPGPLEVTLVGGNGTRTASAPVDVMILARTDAPEPTTGPIGFAQLASSLFVLSGRRFVELDPISLARRHDGVTLDYVPANRSLDSFTVGPDRSRGVIGLSGGSSEQIWAVTLPEFTPIAPLGCETTQALPSRRARNALFHFDASGRWGYAPFAPGLAADMDGIWRLDLTTGACDTIGERSRDGTTQIRAVLPTDVAGELIVAHAQAGFALMDVDPSSATVGQLIRPFTGSVPPTVHQMLLDADGEHVWLVSHLGGLERHHPFGGDPVLRVGDFVLSLVGDIAQSADRRWVVVPIYQAGGLAPGFALVDLLHRQVVGEYRDGVAPQRVIFHPSDASFVVSVSGVQSRYDLRGP